MERGTDSAGTGAGAAAGGTVTFLRALSKTRSAAYTVARDLGWVNALLRGPEAVVRRAVRVFVARKVNAELNKAIGGPKK